MKQPRTAKAEELRKHARENERERPKQPGVPARSGEETQRRGAGRLGTGEMCGGSTGVCLSNTAGDSCRVYVRRPGLRAGPLRSSHPAAAAMVAAGGAAENEPARLRHGGTMALVTVTKATGVGWRRRSRERQWKKISGEGEQQQKFGGQTLHAFRGDPEGDESIEHRPRRAQLEATGLYF